MRIHSSWLDRGALLDEILQALVSDHYRAIHDDRGITCPLWLTRTPRRANQRSHCVLFFDYSPSVGSMVRRDGRRPKYGVILAVRAQAMVPKGSSVNGWPFMCSYFAATSLRQKHNPWICKPRACPCGYCGDPIQLCTCAPSAAAKYQI